MRCGPGSSQNVGIGQTEAPRNQKNEFNGEMNHPSFGFLVFSPICVSFLLVLPGEV